MKISLITTIFNEEDSILKFLKSIKRQSLIPNEVIIVDGGSTDNTLDLISNFISTNKNKLNIKLIIKRGNRSVGRNEAIRNSENNIIAITDAGCVLDKNWLKNITFPFLNKKVSVVAGYYIGSYGNIFEKSIIPYVLVMPDKINPDNFLPATRSMAIRKNIWEKVGKFNEKLSNNEDYEFAKRIENKNVEIYFQKSAFVYWQPVGNLKSAIIMFYRFALGDVESRIFRPKVSVIFLRYFYFLYLILLCLIYRNSFSILLTFSLILFYGIWSIKKNYKYVLNAKAIYYLPIIQCLSDLTVMTGSLKGLFKIADNLNINKIFKKHFQLILILLLYSILVFSSFTWGAPNQNRIYPYHMDEWHQFQSVVNTYRDGTPNETGSANGTMLHFTTTGIYLAPFIATKYISGSVEITDFSLKEKIFLLLRFNTYLYGFFSIIAIYFLLKYLKLYSLIPTLFFTLSPVFILLSGYFKYDIALLFWILISLIFSVRYAKNSTGINFLYIGLFSGFAIATKISALPLIPIYLLAFLLFEKIKIKNLKYFIAGFLNLIFVIIIFGIPDTLFNKGNIYFYLYDNVINVPQVLSTNLNFQINQYQYLFLKQYPIIFGYGLMIGFLISVLLLLITISRKGKVNKEFIFIFLSFLIFLVSLIPLGLAGTGNRSLVLLPFLIIFTAYSFKIIPSNKKKIFIFLISFLVLIQIIQLLGWISIKTLNNPQESSSAWILKNIPKSETIGIENIPIYQRLPDIVNREYNLIPYGVNSTFQYKIVDSKSSKLPNYVIVTYDEIEYTIFKNSPKKLLVNRLWREKYKKIYTVSPNFRYFYFGDQKDYYFSTLLVSPVSVSIYHK